MMFADLVLDFMDVLQELKHGTFHLAHPFDAKPSKILDASPAERWVVDRLLSLLRQTQVSSEDVYFKNLLVFVAELPLEKLNREFYGWTATLLQQAELPSEKEFEVALGHVNPQHRVQTLSATPRHVAALYLYGKLVHRKYMKRRHLGQLLNTFGGQFVFDYCGKYAEHTSWLIVGLAVLWWAHTKGETMVTPDRHQAWIFFSDETLCQVREFLSQIAAPLSLKGTLKWSAPF